MQNDIVHKEYNIKYWYNNKVLERNIVLHKHSAALNSEANSASLNSAISNTGISHRATSISVT